MNTNSINPTINEQEEAVTMTREQVIDTILEYFKNNEDVFNDCIEELDTCNGYLGDDRYYNMDELPELLSGYDPIELLNRAYFGNDENDFYYDRYDEKHYNSFNPNRDYFRFNGYGNLCSTNYKNYSDHLDTYVVEEMSKYRNDIYSIDENIELSELFDRLENTEEA